MFIHTIGLISLNLSTCIYFFWFIPQLALTFKRKNTSGLSFAMHSLLTIGYISDLMYGFGCAMPVQYKCVSICGLGYLSIQHYQFIAFNKLKWKTILTTALLISFLIFSVHIIVFEHRSREFFDTFGMVSNICWFSFMLPQILKNYRRNSVDGLSARFVMLSIFSSGLDTLAAYALGWDWPSKVGAPIGFIQQSIVLWQCFFYKRARQGLFVKS